MQLTFFRIKKIHGFTIMEVMIVTILIGIIAAFAIPNFTNAVKRGRVRDAITQLTAIYAANMIYKANNNGNYYNGASSPISNLNTGLGINIVENGMTYGYSSTGATFTATATWTQGSTFSVEIDERPINMPQTGTGGNPCCTVGYTCVGLNSC